MPQNLTPKQRATIAALLSQPTVSAAAKQVSVSRDAVYRWMKQPAFRDALRQAEQDALDALQRRLVTLGEGAADALQDGLGAHDLRIRLRAADTVLERLLALRTMIDFDARLTALESQR